MNKYEIVKKIEAFAPLETQESWDCSGWGVNKGVNKEQSEIDKILFCLTVTENIVCQARKNGCDMIISHHPLFYVPIEWKDINIYSAHTNLDLAEGGTTDTLIEKLGLKKSENQGFVRIVELEKPISTQDLKQKLMKISPKLRYVNNFNQTEVKTIGFCAGSGSEFVNETTCDAFITGDLKFHTALELNKLTFDIGHFASEIFAPELLKKITEVGERGIIADEKSPFI